MEATDGYGLDVLINNAGFGLMGPMEEVSVDELRRQFEVNVFGLHAFTLPFLPGMRERRHGRIVNVSSTSGRWSMPFMGAYSASKYAVEAMSDAMRLELNPFGVHVVLIEPGPIRTGFGGETGSRLADQSESPYDRFHHRFKGAKRGSDLFTRSPEDVATTIVRAVEAKRPRPRYTVTAPAKLGTAARRLVPDVVADAALRVLLGLRAE
jgi:short-subunit dehydrogenase